MSFDTIVHYAKEANERAARICNADNASPLTVEEWVKHTAFIALASVLIRQNVIAREIARDNPDLADDQDLRELMLPDAPKVPSLAAEIDRILSTENAFATGEAIAASLGERFNITIEPKGQDNG